MRDKVGPLLPDNTYHIYNRSVGSGNQKLFNSEENYLYFTKKYVEHLNPVVETFCYVLMPTHFHFLIRCKSEPTIEEHFINKTKNMATLTEFKTLSGLQRENFLSQHISKQFSHFFNGYSQAFNKENGRHGSLLVRPFKRTPVNTEEYLRNLVRYIHLNPIESNLCSHPEKYKHSSYSTLLSEDPTFLKRDEVLNWFDDKKNFIFHHRQ